MTIPDISPTLLDIIATASVCHTRSIEAITTIMEVITLGTSITLYTLYITSHSQFMTSILNIYDITNTALMTSDLLYTTSHPWFMTSHPLYL